MATVPEHLAPDSSGAMRAAIATGIVQTMARLYGRGPTKAKTYFNDEHVLCVLEGGMTPNEELLIAAGEERLVRQYRLRFQEVVAEQLTSVVEEITHRKVLTYHSQLLFHPARLYEIFLLDRPPGEPER